MEHKKQDIVTGHNIIDAEKLNDLLKKLIPNKLTKFERNFVAYKIAQHEDDIIKKTGYIDSNKDYPENEEANNLVEIVVKLKQENDELRKQLNI